MNDKKPKYQIERTGVFRKDLKRAIKRGLDISLLDDVVTTIQYGEELPEKNKDHALTGNWSGQQCACVEIKINLTAAINICIICLAI